MIPKIKTLFFLCKGFNQVQSFFDKPINSLKLGITIVDNLSTNFTAIEYRY